MAAGKVALMADLTVVSSAEEMVVRKVVHLAASLVYKKADVMAARMVEMTVAWWVDPLEMRMVA